jgi:hypothetical protein
LQGYQRSAPSTLINYIDAVERDVNLRAAIS